MEQSRIDFTEYKKILGYTVAGVVIGVIAGIMDTIFGKVLLAVTSFREAHVMTLVPFLPAAGLLTVWMYRKISPKSLGGMSLIFETGVEENEEIPKALIPLIMLSTWMTHLFGGSAGRVGVTIQIGATISHSIGRKLGKKADPKIFLLMGMSAGFAGLFQTPLAATFFALEVMVVGALFYEAMLPAMVAAFASSFTAKMLGLHKFVVKFEDPLTYNAKTVAKLIFIAILFGIAGRIFSYLLAAAKEKLAVWVKNPYLRVLGFGLILAALYLLLYKGRYCGLGTNLTMASFYDGTIYSYDFLLKAGLTILTLAAGFQGGEIAPLFSIGTTLGVVLATLFGLPTEMIAALGFAAVFGSATNTLIAPIFLGIEMFGANHAVLFTVICIIAFQCNGNRTIYGKQRISQMLDFKDSKREETEENEEKKN